MADLFTALPALDDPSLFNYAELPPIYPKFFVPRLKDQPQNPIIEALPLYQESKHKVHVVKSLPKELIVLSEQVVQNVVERPLRDQDLWLRAGSLKRPQSHFVSWDCLRPTYKPPPFPSPFLTEQPLHIFVAARHHAFPRLYDPNETLIHLNADSFAEKLRITLTGCSSSLHIWNSKTERFDVSGIKGAERAIIILEGMDEVVTESLMARFLVIGTILRRLETLVMSLRKHPSKGNSTLHAFTHALSSVLVHIRNQITGSRSYDSLRGSTLGAFWLSFEETERVLLSLASLCQRDLSSGPEAYTSMLWSPPKLLSHIYHHLTTHVEQQSPRTVRALLAYILTVSSRPYFKELSHSVGFGGSFRNGLAIAHKTRRASSWLEEEDDAQSDDFDFDGESDNSVELPSFVHADLADALDRARRSLKIMHVASPDHPLFAESQRMNKSEWVWTERAILALLKGDGIDVAAPESIMGNDDEDVPNAYHLDNGSQTIAYKQELAQFQVFDMEPGAHLGRRSTSSQAPASPHTLQSFVDSFPDFLPSITPTLPHIASLVLDPLLAYCKSLSNTAVQIFMVPSTLHLRTHLVLLRSYLLLTSHAFKSRLSAALFSDSDENVPGRGGHGSQGTFNPRIRATERPRYASTSAPWAVGLGSGLTERETWPPGGSDLSFYLRRVIVDSLDYVRQSGDDGAGNKMVDAPELWEEAESRLGFAIRDLPVDTGRDKWLDPTSIEALDFLYLDYKPPPPLRCLITRDILSKYQRVFAFLLRLLRVDHVMRLLFRLTRSAKDPVFQTLTAPNTLLLHFRYIGQSFISSLSAYVYDTAIGGNMDAFLAQLKMSESSSENQPTGAFSDIISLTKHHSQVMDDILSACLLRSGQRAVGDILRGSLEILLELGVLIGELRSGRMEEYQVAPKLEELYGNFQRNMMVLTNVLKKVVDKGPTSVPQRSYFENGLERNLPAAPGGSASLHQLLVRLDFTDWWKGAGEKRS